ncbi:hypothetical protein [Kamptonema formosum]|uniref:hypothetical protein n=1 Tax=Kamptonema formosum TaxID=331992 RepID=UPI0012DF7F85|nr:hypothetical protein [Oscillatoria sp. PCC 10802]
MAQNGLQLFVSNASSKNGSFSGQWWDKQPLNDAYNFKAEFSHLSRGRLLNIVKRAAVLSLTLQKGSPLHPPGAASNKGCLTIGLPAASAWPTSPLVGCLCPFVPSSYWERGSVSSAGFQEGYPQGLRFACPQCLMSSPASAISLKMATPTLTGTRRDSPCIPVAPGAPLTVQSSDFHHLCARPARAPPPAHIKPPPAQETGFLLRVGAAQADIQ